ncbi:MAG: DNA-deoxyinosine glycosylase [Gammaproteobacteria bacterium]|nr:DNA-deoxyinosine glycosylase [Gammaproteobacteria bacterium]MDH5344303.1 DNA-deoxyinosine glycosylase [Gammaproteobacteria bacterium]
MSVVNGFPPILGKSARVLVLGTLPSRRSLETNQYYGHPRNAFWPIMGALLGAGPGVPYEERRGILARRQVAVWDVLRSSVRPGSMDADIEPTTAAANDFAALFAASPDIALVCFNGRAAADLWRRLVAPGLQNGSNTVDYQTLPSTSPAHASMSFAQKLEHWRVIAERATP